VLLSANSWGAVDYDGGKSIAGGALAKYTPLGVHVWSNANGAGRLALDAAGGVVVNTTAFPGCPGVLIQPVPREDASLVAGSPCQERAVRFSLEIGDHPSILSLHRTVA
jgi:hypothetical protein